MLPGATRVYGNSPKLRGEESRRVGGRGRKLGGRALKSSAACSGMRKSPCAPITRGTIPRQRHGGSGPAAPTRGSSRRGGPIAIERKPMHG
eukprot:5890562-Pyramimonas_sp.AAC.1